MKIFRLVIRFWGGEKGQKAIKRLKEKLRESERLKTILFDVKSPESLRKLLQKSTNESLTTSVKNHQMSH